MTGGIIDGTPEGEPDEQFTTANGRTVAIYLGRAIDYGHSYEEAVLMDKVATIMLDSAEAGLNKFDTLKKINDDLGADAVDITVNILFGVSVGHAMQENDDLSQSGVMAFIKALSELPAEDEPDDTAPATANDAPED